MQLLESIATRTHRWLRGLSRASLDGRAMLDLLYPPRCASCDATLDNATGAGFCADCLAELPIFVGPTCTRCGAVTATLESPSGDCGVCRDTKFHFDRTIALGEYSGLLRRLVLRAKHDEHVAQGLAELFFEHRQTELAALRPNWIVAVPMHWHRRWQRRTNSAEVIAAALSTQLAVPAHFRRLRRIRSTPPQTSVPGGERFDNVRRAFAARPARQNDGSHVLLVDDVLTTGATCSEAARTLRQAGVHRVSVAVIARSWPGK